MATEPDPPAEQPPAYLADGTRISYGPDGSLIIDPDCLVEETGMAPDPPDYNHEATWEGSPLAKALATVQTKLTAVERNAKGQSGSREHRYADLAAVSSVVLKLLGENGLAFTSRPTLTPDGKFVLAYSLIHESGERENGEYPLGNGTPQQLGSAITYGRRYCLCAITGAVAEAEDDDGHAASQAKQSKPARPRGEANGQSQRLGDDEPGSATRGHITRVQMAYKDLAFLPGERDDMLRASEQIINRPLTGPKGERTHNNLSANEARKLADTLKGYEDRGDLLAALVEAATP